VKSGGDLYQILVEKYKEPCCDIVVSNNEILSYGFKMLVYVSKGDKKGAIIERFNRTLKSRLEMFFTETGKHTWIDSIQLFTANYNDSYHSSIGMAPSNVTLLNQNEVYAKLYPEENRRDPCYFQVNDRVRIAIQKTLFDKGYVQSGIQHILQN